LNHQHRRQEIDMDGLQFDAWTRRRLGLMTGGFAATVLGLGFSNDADAKKKRRRRKKKRCKKLGDTCTQGGKRKCCKGTRCDLVGFDSILQTFCCHDEGGSCTADTECCQGLGCFEGTCQSPVPSDRAIKANFGSVDPADMLARVRDLPIATWNYINDDSSVRHIGPMAQDFAAAFSVGADDRHIHPIDGQGVALAAIQGLAAEIERLREENARLAERIAALED
jgi:hypothetical protein